MGRRAKNDNTRRVKGEGTIRKKVMDTKGGLQLR